MHPALQVTNIWIPRGTGSDVVDDPSAVIGIDAATVGTGSRTTMVNLTNQFQNTSTTTIRLTGVSKDRASLYINGVQYGDSATVDISAGGGNQIVEAALKCDDSLVGDFLTYEIEVDTGGINGSIKERTVPIDRHCIPWYEPAD